MSEPKTHSSAGIERIEFLFERRVLLSRIGVVVFALSLLIACLWPKTYKSSASIMPPGNSSMGAAMFAALAGRSSSGLGSLGSLAGSLLGANNSSAIYMELLRSGTINGEIIDRFELQKVYHKRYRVDTLKALARHVQILNDKKSDVITLVVEDHDPQRARDMADAYLDGLNRQLNRTSTSSARQERIFVERRLLQSRRDLEQAQLALSEFSSTHGTIDLKEQARAEVTSGAALQAQILLEESNINSMRQIYGDGNVRLRAAEARAASLRAQLKRIAGSSAPLADESTESVSDAIAPSLRQLPRLAVPFADRYREVQVQEKLFELLTEQFEMARINEARDIPVLKVIDAPAVAEKKSFPPRALMTLALWFGVMSLVCIGWLLLDHLQEHSQDARVLLMRRIVSSLVPAWGQR
ncbi:Capsule polysaccharide export protein KpsE/RkpR [Terriglobus roseus]|uniref:Capsule polysaccharide export protein KpsE/RkpR n=2 Tax=Terriglobus roseus TaxID=392734 RepID=A0A1G7KK69_9BACT|nr:Capsule polysaccharide export protein KpsE/RkpR [Terriglobus roseus]